MNWTSLSFSQFADYTFYLTAALALVLDLLFADPEGFPHPVVFVGKITAYLDRRLNRPLLKESERYARGLLVASLLPASLSLALYGFLRLFFEINPWLYFAMRVFIAGQLLAIQGLAKEANAVAIALRNDGLIAARKQLSRIVGRETTHLTDQQVIKATVETVAENFADGVVAPLFYFVLFDLTGMFFYKAVNTLDSMIAYRNARYEHFGKAAAKLDDLLNYLPARLAAFFLWLASVFSRLDHRSAWRIFWRDRYNHLSPNSAQTEAVVAGALGIQLGGTHTYRGVEVEKPTIGDFKRLPEIRDIDKTIKLLYLASVFAFLSFLGIRFLLNYILRLI